jgi:hypothetical protein
MLILLKLQLVAGLFVAGVDTSDISNISPKVFSVLQTLADEQKNNAKDLNASFNTAYTAISEMAKQGDKDAAQVLARWTLSSNNKNSLVEAVDLYQKAVELGSVLAKAELAQIYFQGFTQSPEKIEQAIKLTNEAAAAGNNIGRRLKADLLIKGTFTQVPRDWNEAYKVLKLASDAKDEDATYQIAMMYNNGGPKFPKDEVQALAFLKLAVDQGNESAMSIYGSRLLNGDKPSPEGKVLVEKRPVEAMKLFEKAAENGFAGAMTILGRIHEFGNDVVKVDYTKALEYYTKAANNNDSIATYRLGLMCETGYKDSTKEDAKVLIQPNPKNALDLFRRAAMNKHAAAYYKLGNYYEAGAVVDKDLEKAHALYMRAANMGVVEAQHSVAVLYQNGSGVPQDLVAASSWFQRAAARNYAPSQIVLGEIYERGLGVEQNYTAAAQQYANAIELGAPMAMLKLASLYYRGVTDKNGEPDLSRAWTYLNMAAEATKQAEQVVKMKEELEKKMTQTQKDEAKKIFDQKKMATKTASATESLEKK